MPTTSRLPADELAFARAVRRPEVLAAHAEIRTLEEALEAAEVNLGRVLLAAIDAERTVTAPVHWLGEDGAMLHAFPGVAAVAAADTSGDEDEVTCDACIVQLGARADSATPAILRIARGVRP